MDNRTEDKEAAAYDESLKGTFVSVFLLVLPFYCHG
ncbi:hypothetical protein MGA3_06860 [Bacillus methanolicus MGA3]|nr:hypothetical protein MGA3_06860 [Bacillus methanolicus MGA3]